jgi:hypothetical protein
MVLLWAMFRRQQVTGASLVPMGLLYVVFAIAVVLLGGAS